jgi:hypothetical protein
MKNNGELPEKQDSNLPFYYKKKEEKIRVKSQRKNNILPK